MATPKERFKVWGSLYVVDTLNDDETIGRATEWRDANTIAKLMNIIAKLNPEYKPEYFGGCSMVELINFR